MFWKKMFRKYRLTVLNILFLMTASSLLSLYAADLPTIPLVTATSPAGEVTYNVSVKILLVMTLLTVLPALLMTMTAFMRIIIVLSILRQAIGIPNVPSNQILIGLALIMTVYVMMPIFNTINETSLQPYLKGSISEQQAMENAEQGIRGFLLKQTRKADLSMFTKLSSAKTTMKEAPLYVIVPAFITSELKTAFQIGFLLFLPFLIIDLVTASVLMSMGMMMLSPMMISLPFKILFFVMVNGWALIVSSLVSSFRI